MRSELCSNVLFAACGGKINLDSGYLQSPGYPESVHSERGCEWTITVPEGRRITLDLLDFDLVESYGDGLYICQDENYNAMIAYLPDANHTTVVKSSSNVMQLWYYIHPSSHRGFRARFTSDEPTSN